MEYKHTASFGKRAEYFIIAQMLNEGLDCFVPLVDDEGIDVVVKKDDHTFIMVQIKARSKNVKNGDAALFANLHHEPRDNYFFVFYSERMQKDTEKPFYWILSSEEFLKLATTNKSGKHIGSKCIWFNGTKTNKLTGKKEEYIKDRFQKYVYTDFKKIIGVSDIND